MGWTYAPDLPTETPNTWRVIDGFHPTNSGAYRSGWLPTEAISTATGASVPFQWGFAYKTAAGTAGLVLTYLSGNTLTGNSYVWNGSTWNDRKAASSQFATCFVQVGNITLGGGYVQGKPGAILTGLVQRDATTTNNFAAVASSPNAGVLAVNALNIVMALDTASDGFAFSDTSAPTLWTGGESTSGNCRLTQGNFTGGVALGNDFICFKDRGVYRATYVGGVVKWTFTLLDAEKGAWAPGCVVFGGGKVYFLGRAGFWSFDGANFERLDYGVGKTMQGVLAVAVPFGPYYYATQLLYDTVTQTVFVFQLSNPSAAQSARFTGANRFYTFNTISKKWGYQGRLSETSTTDYQAVFDLSPFNSYATSFTTDGDGHPQFNTDIGFFNNTADKIYALHTNFNSSDLPGTNYKPNIRSYRLGVRDKMTTVTRFIPNWTLEDGAGSDLSTATVKTATFYTSDSVMEGSVAMATATLSTDQYRADTMQSARWHNVELKINAPAVIDGGTWVYTQAGTD